MRHYWLGSILLSTTLGSPAATLGSHNGAALLGRPLDFRVHVTLAPGENPGALCVKPDVFYGDSQVLASNVTSSLQAGASGTDAILHIRSSQPVNEPIVTVTVGIGCTSIFSRRYVLLADPVSEAVIARERPEEGTATSMAPSANVPMVALPGSAGAPAMPPRPSRAANQATPPVAAPKAGPRTSLVRQSAPASAKPAEHRLELDLLDIDLTAERDPVLRLTPRLLSDPEATNPDARLAAIQLWKAINVAPDTILRDQQRLETLETESKAWREREARQRAQVEVLEARLQTGERWRWIGYVLAGAMLLALLLVVTLWRRRAAPQGEDTGVPSWAGAAVGRGASRTDGAVTALPRTRKVSRRPATPVDIELTLGDDDFSPGDVLSSTQAAVKSNRPAPAGVGGGLAPAPAPASAARSLATEELFDVQQQADFFMSLGEHEQAIRVLREHLDESHEPSPLTYLDLFKIYHQLGHRDAYEALRADFNQVFNAGAPPFEQYSTHSRGLESYEKAFSRIQALWPQPKVLEVIERSIFRDNQAADEEVFDLEAYRELLLLHALAKDMIQREASQGDMPNDFQHTALKPLNAAASRAPGAPELEREAWPDKTSEFLSDDLAPVSPNAGLDIDLDDLADADVFDIALTEDPAPEAPMAGTRQVPAGDMSDNLIDFELLDFLPSDRGDQSAGRP